MKLIEEELSFIVLDCLNSFPKSTNFFSEHAKIVMTQEIVKKIKTLSRRNKMKLSDQALGAVMMALQKSLLEESDIVPVLKGFEFVTTDDPEDELVVKNPPTFTLDTATALNDENNN